MMVKKMWKLVPVALASCVVGMASAAQPAPAAMPPAAKPMAADAGKAAAAKKGADAQAMAEDSAVANYKKNKGGMAKK